MLAPCFPNSRRGPRSRGDDTGREPFQTPGSLSAAADMCGLGYLPAALLAHLCQRRCASAAGTRARADLIVKRHVSAWNSTLCTRRNHRTPVPMAHTHDATCLPRTTIARHVQMNSTVDSNMSFCLARQQQCNTMAWKAVRDGLLQMKAAACETCTNDKTWRSNDGTRATTICGTTAIVPTTWSHMFSMKQ